MKYVDGLLNHIGEDYENMSEEQKIKMVMEIVYINLANAKKDIFDRMTSNDNNLLAGLMRRFGMGNLLDDDNEQEFDKAQKITNKRLFM